MENDNQAYSAIGALHASLFSSDCTFASESGFQLFAASSPASSVLHIFSKTGLCAMTDSASIKWVSSSDKKQLHGMFLNSHWDKDNTNSQIKDRRQQDEGFKRNHMTLFTLADANRAILTPTTKSTRGIVKKKRKRKEKSRKVNSTLVKGVQLKVRQQLPGFRGKDKTVLPSSPPRCWCTTSARCFQQTVADTLFAAVCQSKRSAFHSTP